MSALQTKKGRRTAKRIRKLCCLVQRTLGAKPRGIRPVHGKVLPSAYSIFSLRESGVGAAISIRQIGPSS